IIAPNKNGSTAITVSICLHRRSVLPRHRPQTYKYKASAEGAMTTFIQIHTLQTFPACNLNRGDDGRPKTVKYCGVERIRYSSQALKFALRNGPALRAALGDVFGKRTKWLGYEIRDRLKAEKVPAEKADQIGAHVTEIFSKIDDEDATGLKSKTLYFVGRDE